MTRASIIFSIFPILLIFTGCGFQNEEGNCVEQPDLSGVEAEVEYISLEEEFLSIGTEEGLRAFVGKHPVIGEYFLKRSDFPTDDVFYSELLARLQNPHIDSLRMDVKEVFSNYNLKHQFEEAFRHLKYYYPEVELPKVKTIATGFDQDMYVSDSLIIVSLDFYLGEGARYRPLDVYEYMLRRYSPEYIVPSVMLIYGISPGFNKTDLSDNSILADMITYGKAFYFAKHMMPCTPDSVMIWYSSEEMEGVNNHEEIIWAHFIENELLFKNSHEVKRKYIEERPKTYEIGNAAPGRIGTWLGWEIVKSFMDRKPDVDLQGLMEIGDAQTVFRESKYKPR